MLLILIFCHILHRNAEKLEKAELERRLRMIPRKKQKVSLFVSYHFTLSFISICIRIHTSLFQYHINFCR